MLGRRHRSSWQVVDHNNFSRVAQSFSVSLTEEEEEQENYKNDDLSRIAAEEISKTGPRRSYSQGYSSDRDTQRQRGYRSQSAEGKQLLPLRTFTSIFVGSPAAAPVESLNYARPSIADDGNYSSTNDGRLLSGTSSDLQRHVANTPPTFSQTSNQAIEQASDSALANGHWLLLDNNTSGDIVTSDISEGHKASLQDGRHVLADKSSPTTRLASQDPAVILLMRNALLADQELDAAGEDAEISPTSGEDNNRYSDPAGRQAVEKGEIGNGRRLARAEAVEEEHEVIIWHK
jgi:hypothetical protein